MRFIKYPITPVSKPRMTRQDKWKERPCVLRYRAFADECRLRKVKVPQHGAHVIFVMPMPKSWTENKKEIWAGQAHQQKPDLDNLCKSLFDALYKDDSGIADIRITKIWGMAGMIAVGEA